MRRETPMNGMSSGARPRAADSAPVGVGDRADHRGGQQRDDVDLVLGRPLRAAGVRDAEPQRRVRRWTGESGMGTRVEAVALAVVRQLVAGQALEQDLEALVEALAPAIPVDVEEADLDRRHARADAELQPPVAEVVEHADLVDGRSG